MGLPALTDGWAIAYSEREREFTFDVHVR